MAVKYKLYQNTRQQSEQFGLWYARAAADQVIDIKQISKDIEEKCTLTESDVRGVIIELLKQMKKHLCNGHRVWLEDFGSFKVGLRTSPAKSAKEFTASTNVKGVRVNFLPATHQGADKKRVINLLDGVKVQEQGTYKVDKGDEAADGGGDQPNP